MIFACLLLHQFTRELCTAWMSTITEKKAIFSVWGTKPSFEDSRPHSILIKVHMNITVSALFPNELLFSLFLSLSLSLCLCLCFCLCPSLTSSSLVPGCHVEWIVSSVTDLGCWSRQQLPPVPQYLHHCGSCALSVPPSRPHSSQGQAADQHT